MDRAALTRRLAHIGLGAAVTITACSGSQPGELPPAGEAILVVDTDLPAEVAQRLRIDVYEDGRWIESRDLLREGKGAWPASFSVYAGDPDASRTALVRMRVYREGRRRPYRGESYEPRTADFLGPDQPLPVGGDGSPKLLRDGIDVTPPFEPIPLVTVDRLLRVHVVPGRRGLIRVLLRGECVGTMADLAHEQTCVDTSGVLVAAGELPSQSDLTIPTDSKIGTFPGDSSCTVEPRPGTGTGTSRLFDQEVCIPGALTFVGVPYAEGLFTERGVEVPAVLGPFLIDAWEVTVARYRYAIDHRHYVPLRRPIQNEAPTLNVAPMRGESQEYSGLCTWSRDDLGRGLYALNCVTQAEARSFCQFDGGDLPTEAQWYQAAVITNRPLRTAYPWGDRRPDCNEAVYARLAGDDNECHLRAPGPANVLATPKDLSVSGLHYMHGGMAEWLIDRYRHLYQGCWYAAPLHEPFCDDPGQPLFSFAGISWADDLASLNARREPYRPDGTSTLVGFRCVRPGVAK